MDDIESRLTDLRRQQEEEQALNDMLLARARQTDAKLKLVEAEYKSAFPEWVFSARFRVTVRTIIEQLPLVALIDAMRLAVARVPDRERVLRYFCAICWNWIRRPETRTW